VSLYAYAAAGLVALVLLAGSHWKAYSAGQSEVRTEWLTAQTIFQAQARRKESALSAQINEARNAAAKRETTLRADAAGARRSADGLRDTIANIKRGLPELPADAASDRADALADVFLSCVFEYRDMAEQVDRITSDRQTLTEAWPK
jgi:hypothetical protein